MKHQKLSIILFIKGFCMGVADIIPGISGGTIALILGIYEQFIKALHSVNLKFFKNIFKLQIKDAFNGIEWLFLVNLLAGMLTAIIVLSKGLEYLLDYQPEYLFSFFFGLVLATIPLIARLVERWTFLKISTALITSILTFWIIIQKPAFSEPSGMMIFISGFVAISAMILPGISGSFILLLMGQYRNIIQAINDKDLTILCVFLTGICLGVFTIVRLLGYLFKRFHDLTIAAIIGIIAGSLPKIWPWKDTISFIEGRHGEMLPLEQVNIIPYVDVSLYGALLLLVAGFSIAFLLNRMPEKIQL